jgi:quercetin dioxygenase-like cupin family protein
MDCIADFQLNYRLDESDAAADTRSMTHAHDLPGSPAARRFIGADHGGAPLSMFLVDGEPGSGPGLHRHPYAEVFVVHSGQARFEVDDAVIAAAAGDILVAPAGSAHRFTNSGGEPLRMTAIHAAPRMETDWL